MINISIQIEILSTKYLLVKGKFGIPRTVYISFSLSLSPGASDRTRTLNPVVMSHEVCHCATRAQQPEKVYGFS